jgi:hypothetical protein
MVPTGARGPLSCVDRERCGEREERGAGGGERSFSGFIAPALRIQQPAPTGRSYIYFTVTTLLLYEHPINLFE